MDFELELGMASEMTSVRSEMVAGMVPELQMDMASGMLLESQLIGHVCFEEVDIV
jgi:hypothetical protein